MIIYYLCPLHFMYIKHKNFFFLRFCIIKAVDRIYQNFIQDWRFKLVTGESMNLCLENRNECFVAGIIGNIFGISCCAQSLFHKQHCGNNGEQFVMSRE